jgi:signal transduction histidine kinase
MGSLIERIVRVLHAQESVADYEVSLAELAEVLAGRLKAAAHAAGVRLETSVTAAGTLSNREADLILLILENLLQNSLEATPAGKAVRLNIFQDGGRIIIEVQDEGPGLPPAVAGQLFTPCVSTKTGGSGVGLAISRQLAKHLGAELELKESSPRGCTFRLALPTQATDPEKHLEAAALK